MFRVAQDDRIQLIMEEILDATPVALHDRDGN